MPHKQQEKLNSELASYVEKTSFLTMLRHPLAVMPYMSPSIDEPNEFNAMLNELVARKAKRLAELEAEKDYMAALVLIERPFRLEYAIKHLHSMDVATYWEVVRFVWLDSEFPSQSNQQVWETIFASRTGNPSLESAEFAALPDTVTIYRGGDELALSWTTDKEQALWFANRWGEQQALWKATVDKCFILHVDATENEIVVDPCHVQGAVNLRDNDN